MSRPDFIVVGHVVKDIIPGGWRLGGTATFAALQATRLGVSTGVVTRTSPDLDLATHLPDVSIAGRPSATATSFENIYDGWRRTQRVPVQAEPIDAQDVPEEWFEAPLALLGPVCSELPPRLGERFSGGLVGAAAQGWLRELDEERRVRPRSWRGEPFWRGCRVLFVSDEDLGGRREAVDAWSRELPLVVVTAADRGATVVEGERERSIAAFPAEETDPTGAGDIFAAAFLVRYHETDDVAECARFASAAAACSVEGAGGEAIAGREAIERRMGEHPGIVLR